MGPRSSRAWQSLVPAALFLLAGGVRVLTWPTVFLPGRTLFHDPDSYYHLRRIVFALERFPTQLGFDPYLNYPSGAKAIWPATFDLGVAAFVWPFFRAGGVLAAERAAVWVPVLLGAATVVALYRLADRFFGRAAAVLSGAILSVSWGHVHYTQLGYVDHHAAVGFVSILLLGSAMSLLAASARDELAGRAGTRRSVALGAALAGLLLVWPGGLLQVAVVELGVAAVVAFAGTLPRGRGLALRAAQANLVAFAAVLPSGLASDWPQWGAFSPNVLSHFQPWLFGAAAAFFGTCAAALRWPGCEPIVRRPGAVLSIGLAVAGASAVLVPGLLEGVAEAWRWLAKDELFQSLVRESRPLLFFEGELDFTLAEKSLSRFVYLSPLALLLFCWCVRKRADAPALWLFAAWTGALAIAALQQARFLDGFSVALSLLFGWSAAELWRSAPRAWRHVGWRRAAAAATAALALAFVLAPTFGPLRLPLRNARLSLRGTPIPLSIRLAHTLALLRTAEWLRAHSPLTSGYLDPNGTPEYGLLSHWQYGHVLLYTAQRPTVVGNFGDDVGDENFALGLAYLAAEEHEAAALLDRLGARYVVARPLDWAEGHRDPRTMARRLGRRDLAGLERHRLVFETPVRRTGSEAAAASFRVFEVVPGAIVEGRSEPGGLVHATLGYDNGSGQTGRIEARARADSEGRYVLQLAHASEGMPGGIRLDESYRLVSGSATASLSVSEGDVRTGVRLAGPTLK